MVLWFPILSRTLLNFFEFLQVLHGHKCPNALTTLTMKLLTPDSGRFSFHGHESSNALTAFDPRLYSLQFPRT
ncbi:hypothetical protein BDR07DRAFT_1391953 [Suillus spraguei]|nr:hypothetical protein BDR07DRAFT_1391953 [Suillus spraguei]